MFIKCILGFFKANLYFLLIQKFKTFLIFKKVLNHKKSTLLLFLGKVILRHYETQFFMRYFLYLKKNHKYF